MFIILIEGDIGQCLVSDELFLGGVFSCQVEICMPRAGIEVDLVPAEIIIVQGNGLMMMCVAVDNVSGGLIQKGWFFQSETGKGAIGCFFSVLQAKDKI